MIVENIYKNKLKKCKLIKESDRKFRKILLMRHLFNINR